MKATMSRRLALGAGAAAAALFALTPPATAAPCGARDLILKELADTYQEVRTAIGLIATGELLEIFVSPAGTWTAVVSKPNGWACIVASGEAWTHVPMVKGREA